jgi:hypothetical protein
MAAACTITVAAVATGLTTGSKTFSGSVAVTSPVDSESTVTLLHAAATACPPPTGATQALITFPATGGPYNLGASALEPAFANSGLALLPLLDADSFTIFNAHASVDAVVTILWF